MKPGYALRYCSGRAESAWYPCNNAWVDFADWNDVRYFLALSRVRTLAGVARRLGVDQTTVGRRIAAFERAVGARLFQRTATGFVLTDAGARIIPTAEKLEDSWFDIERSIAGQEGRVEGAVRLATSETLASGFLVRLLASLRARHPGLDLELVMGRASVNLLKREADLAVRAESRPTQQDLIVKRLVQVGWALYATRGYLDRVGVPGRRNELAGHDLLAFDDELGGILAAQWVREHARRARAVVRSNSILALAECCACGGGLGLLPCFLGDARSTLRRVWPKRLFVADVFLVLHPDLQHAARVRAVVELLVEATVKHKKALEG